MGAGERCVVSISVLNSICLAISFSASPAQLSAFTVGRICRRRRSRLQNLQSSNITKGHLDMTETFFWDIERDDFIFCYC